MRILLIHHNINNTGDDAMVESTINQMREVFPDCSIVLESADTQVSKNKFPQIEVVERLFSVRNINHTGKTISIKFALINFPFLLRSFFALITSYIFYLLNLNKLLYPILAEYKKADLILSVAGDSISEEYAWFFRFYEIWLINRLNRPLILYGQSIGPFTGRKTSLARKYLSLTTAIFARDNKTFDLLHEYGVETKIYQTADLAIDLKEQANPTTHEMIERLGLNANSIGIVLRTSKYIHLKDYEYESYILGMKEVIDKLCKENYNPIFVASIPEDAETARVFSRHHNFDFPILETYKVLPSEAKTILANMGLIISPRMHPVILSSSMGVPVIGLGKEFKMLDYMKLMGIEKYFLQMIPFNKEEFERILNDVLINRSDVKKMLGNNLGRAKQLSLLNALLVKELYKDLAVTYHEK